MQEKLLKKYGRTILKQSDPKCKGKGMKTVKLEEKRKESWDKRFKKGYKKKRNADNSKTWSYFYE